MILQSIGIIVIKSKETRVHDHIHLQISQYSSIVYFALSFSKFFSFASTCARTHSLTIYCKQLTIRK